MSVLSCTKEPKPTFHLFDARGKSETTLSAKLIVLMNLLLKKALGHRKYK